MKILIIEDDTLLEKTLCMRLSDAGHQVTVAENGKDALATWEKHGPFEVLLCDVVMPELSGPSFIREAKRKIGPGEINVIMMSALTDGESFIRKLEVDYDYYLPKPFSLDMLNHILQRIGSRKAG